MRIWIAELHISRRVATKLASKHGLEEWRVRDALVAVAGLTAVGVTSPVRGHRMFVRTDIDGVVCEAVLYPHLADPDVFALASCYPVH